MSILDPKSQFRGRFAPSPTGDLHLGNARTALLAWLQARAAGGRFVLRVEDLDRGRVRPGIMEAQLADLRWLGLDWDEGPDVGGPFAPYEQSRRQGLYEQALRRLAARGLLYGCFCTRREIAGAASAPNGPDDEGPVYPGTCRALTPEEVEQRRAERGEAAVRFRVPARSVGLHDLLQGDRTFRPAEETGDFVVRRKDGVAAYQLAVVVDDAAMEVTHVVRGADLLPSTARQLLLYEALGLEPPAWIHVPLLLGPDGERLAKRHGAVSLRELREGGVRPETVVGWLAATCGLADAGEEAAPRDLLGRFSLERLPREPLILPATPWR
ncbi:MAG TPA: tRNA glutamyl-Q(34) synthetase GluQRS [Longimicrobiaceae bacterium]|nr:tRNA glutamyl-Q(34) synthetase GluQRS [Longimicrobiaceae bacterium]